MPARTRRRSSLGRPLQVAIILLCAVLFAVGIYIGIQVAKPPPRPDFAALGEEARATDRVEGAESSNSLPEVVPVSPTDTTGREATSQPPRHTPESDGGAPRVALVIDDLGRSLADLDTLAALGVPLTYAVLPFESHTREVVAALRRRGVEMLCHLPMEAKGDANPGPGALSLDMSPTQLVAATELALDAVPGAVGVNNHTGSAIASDSRAITTVLEVVAGRSLYFLDSRTSADTLGFTVARQLGVPAGERNVFLDSSSEEAAIEAQFDRLLEVARQQGAAIAIAHPYPETLEVLGRKVAEARRAGIRFVPVSALLEG